MLKHLLCLNKWKSEQGNKTCHVSFLSRRPLLSRVTLWIINGYIIVGLLQIITIINTTMGPLTESLHAYCHMAYQTKERGGGRLLDLIWDFYNVTEFPVKKKEKRKQPTSKGNCFGSNDTKALWKANHFGSMRAHKLLESRETGKLTLRGRICG